MDAILKKSGPRPAWEEEAHTNKQVEPAGRARPVGEKRNHLKKGGRGKANE